MVVMAVIAGVSAVVGIVGGVMSSNAAEAEAERAQQYAAYNAAQQQAWGRDQAQLSMATAMYNAQNIREQTEYNNQLNDSWIDYNAGMIEVADAYNSLLYDDQMAQIVEAADLNQLLLARDYAKDRGNILAKQSASGTSVGFGSNKDVIIDQMADEALMSMVIEHNAQNQVNSVLNAQALGTWEANAAIEKLRYEGQLSAAGATYNAEQTARSSLFSGMASAVQSTSQGANNAQSSLITGQQTADNQNAQASMYMTQGLMTGGRYAVQAYGAYDSTSSSSGSLLTESDSSTYNDYGGIGGR